RTPPRLYSQKTPALIGNKAPGGVFGTRGRVESSEPGVGWSPRNPGSKPRRIVMHATRGTTLLVCLLSFSVSSAQQAKPPERYEVRREHDPNGIGKFYMGREIAQVMGHLGAGWLERPEREREEEPAKLMKALKLRPGDVVADIGAG